MLWITHDLGDGSQACELVLSFAVYKGFGNTPTFSVNERPMEGKVYDGETLMEHIKDCLREGTIIVSLNELPGFTHKP